MYDPETGERKLRKKLTTTSTKNSDRMPDCIGAQHDLVWIWTASDKLHGRAVSTGDTVVSASEVSRALGGQVHHFGFDEDTGQLVLQGKDARTHTVTNVTGSVLTLAPVDRFDSGLRQSTPTVGMSTSSVGGSHTLPDGTRIHTRRTSGRHEVFAGEQRLGTDWLHPTLLRNPRDRSLLWPKPASVLIVDKPQIGAKRYTISRVSLVDGKILWTFRPPKDGLQVRQTSSWQPTANGNTLLYFLLGAEMLGIDSATGRTKFVVKM